MVYDGPTAALTRERLKHLYGTQSDELFERAMSIATPTVPVAPMVAPLPALQAA